jgi:hypothetical protein
LMFLVSFQPALVFPNEYQSGVDVPCKFLIGVGVLQ